MHIKNFGFLQGAKTSEYQYITLQKSRVYLQNAYPAKSLLVYIKCSTLECISYHLFFL